LKKIKKLEYLGLNESPNVGTDFFYATPGNGQPVDPPKWPDVLLDESNKDRPGVIFRHIMKYASGWDWEKDYAMYEKEFWMEIFGEDFIDFEIIYEFWDDKRSIESGEEHYIKKRHDELEEDDCDPEYWTINIYYNGAKWDDTTMRAIGAALFLGTMGNGMTFAHCRNDGSIKFGFDRERECSMLELKQYGCYCSC
jgi:hypothetical protein